MSYSCIVCGDERPATMLQTSLTKGQTIAYCDDDAPVVLIGGLADQLGVEMEGLYASIQRYVDREAKKATAELAKLEAAKATEGQAPGDGQAAADTTATATAGAPIVVDDDDLIRASGDQA